MKHALPKMTNDVRELLAYFKAVENLFVLYDVPKNRGLKSYSQS